MAEKLSVKVFEKYPAYDEAALDAMLNAEIASSDFKFIVLDDDPTGVQTVHDIYVYTDWTPESLAEGLKEDNKVFYVLTNSRGLTQSETEKVHTEIAEAAAKAYEMTGVPYLFISRSDSTLRGHFPLETRVLKENFERLSGIKIDGEILMPFFKEGGRFTIDDIHYVKYGDELVPAADTEFAKDRTFGYKSLTMQDYVEEKTGGEFKADTVLAIGLDELRAVDIDGIKEKLMAVTGYGKVIVNAIDYGDVKVFAIALYRAMKEGKRFMARTAAGFVKVMGGVTDRPLLSREDMVTETSGAGGVIVVGSHTAKTTAQLGELLKLDGIVPVEFRSSAVLDGDEAFYAEVARCVAEEEKIIRSGKTSVCFTERVVLDLPDDTPESALVRSVKISDGVQRMVADLTVTPAFVIAKGGITSSDVGTKALKVRKALVLGQIRPGIPVWQTGSESKFPGTPYVIFPGNVGEVETLREAAEILMK
ncbi:MAG: hydroxyacid dehydrogenase [Eubacterium sp.]|nr:hydroxyacid dehydrogenase [Eubacterium sp.]